MIVPEVPEGSYVVVVEPTETGFSAYLPDIPGCIATGRDLNEVQHNIRVAFNVYVGIVLDQQLELPPPRTSVAFMFPGEPATEEARVASSGSWHREYEQE